MQDDEVEWDDAKAAANAAKHGISFHMARDVFREPFALDWLDRASFSGEDRFAIIGMVAARLPVRRVHDERRQDPHHFGESSRTP